jgi:hypothetical protein
MTMDEIRTWALEHGFTADGPSRLVAPWRGIEVEMTFLRRHVRVSMSKAGLTQAIGTFHPVHARLDEHGMVEGIGLSASFLERMRPGDEKPVWLPDAWWRAFTAATAAPGI